MNKYNTRVDHLTNQFVSKFESLTESDLNWKSNSDTWSIAQNIDHLISVNESYMKVFLDLEKGDLELPFTRKFSFLSNFFGKTLLKAVGPDRNKKTKTFGIWQPQDSSLGENILDRFIDCQNELKKSIASLENHLKKGPIIHSPVNRQIVLPLHTALEIILSHEERHFNQAREVAALLNKA